MIFFFLFDESLMESIQTSLSYTAHPISRRHLQNLMSLRIAYLNETHTPSNLLSHWVQQQYCMFL